MRAYFHFLDVVQLLFNDVAVSQARADGGATPRAGLELNHVTFIIWHVHVSVEMNQILIVVMLENGQLTKLLLRLLSFCFKHSIRNHPEV